MVPVGVTVTVAVIVGVSVAVAVSEAVADGLIVAVAVSVADGVSLGVSDGDGDAVSDGCSVLEVAGGDASAVTSGVRDGLAVALALAVGLTDPVGVSLVVGGLIAVWVTGWLVCWSGAKTCGLAGRARPVRTKEAMTMPCKARPPATRSARRCACMRWRLGMGPPIEVVRRR
jgi:hypothetical protein